MDTIVNESSQRNQSFTPEEDLELERLYVDECLPIQIVSKRMGRTKNSIRSRLGRLRLFRNALDGPRYCAAEVQMARVTAAKATAMANRRWNESMREIWTVRGERARKKLYNGHRYEDADVPRSVPRCGRVG